MRGNKGKRGGSRSGKGNAKAGGMIEAKIERIVPNGYGLARAEGKAVFVPLAAAGDRVSIRLRQNKGTLAFGEIVEVLEASPARISPKCQYFGKCGGCDFQQMSDAAQLGAKEAILRDCLARIGRIIWDANIETHKSPLDFGYRSRARLQIDSRKRKIGFFRRNSNEVFDVPHCEVLTHALNETLKNIRANTSFGEILAERAEIEVAGGEACVSVYSEEVISNAEESYADFAGFRYFFDARCFFQGNHTLLEKLIGSAISETNGKHALDLYCGVGLFSLPLSRNFEKVSGIEANEYSIRYAKKNAQYGKCGNVDFHAEDVSGFLSGIEEGSIDFILLDPPRSGAAPATISALIAIKPKEISYVSCDPATFARDLRLLTEGGYKIKKIELFDLFPQTHHVESLARLILA